MMNTKLALLTLTFVITQHFDSVFAARIPGFSKKDFYERRSVFELPSAGAPAPVPASPASAMPQSKVIYRPSRSAQGAAAATSVQLRS